MKRLRPILGSLVVPEFAQVYADWASDQMVLEAMLAFARRCPRLSAVETVAAAFEALEMLERARPEWSDRLRKESVLSMLLEGMTTPPRHGSGRPQGHDERAAGARGRAPAAGARPRSG